MSSVFPLTVRRTYLLFGVLACCLPTHAADQHWLRVSSAHFIVTTDAGEKPGHDVAAHFEQMRTVFGQLLSRSKLRMSEPMEIIAFRGDNKEYSLIAPPVNAPSANSPGFWLSSEDRVFV